MQLSGFTHVSVHATDVEKAASFYESLFDVEREPSPAFGIPVVWLSFGERQLHLFERDIDAPSYHHFAVAVNDFNEFYTRATDRDLLLNEDDPMGSDVYELPDGSVQMYLRDPSGNLLEVNYPDVTDLNEDLRARIVRREDQFEQSAENRRATLFPTE